MTDKKSNIISIVGNSGTGKTTLIEKLIPELKNKGYKAGVIKHIPHTFETDQKGKDSFRYKEAGAYISAAMGDGKISFTKNIETDSLSRVLHLFCDADILITEGFKKENTLKIEVMGDNDRIPVCLEDKRLKAVVARYEIRSEIRSDILHFSPYDITAIADFIKKLIIK